MGDDASNRCGQALPGGEKCARVHWHSGPCLTQAQCGEAARNVYHDDDFSKLRALWSAGKGDDDAR